MNKFLSYKFYIIFLIVILLLFAVATVIDYYKFYPILITKDSILYIFSLIPQMIIGLLALTLVALPYQFNLLENKVNQDDQWVDAVSKSKCFIFNNFIAIFLIGIAIVIFSSLSLGSFNYKRIQDYSFTLSILGFLIFISYFIYLIIYSFDPNRLQKIENQYITKLNHQIKSSTKPETQSVQAKGFDISNISTDLNVDNTDRYDKIQSFINKFDRLEQKIIALYKKEFGGLVHVPFNQAINQFLMRGKITIEQNNDLNQLRRFRNALLHRDPQQEVKSSLLNHYNKILEKVILELKI